MSKLMKQLRKMFVPLVGLALFAGVVFWSLAVYERPSKPKYTGPIESVSTGIVAEYSALSIIAQQQGYFKENGLNVSIQDYVSGPAAVSDLLAGKIDIVTAADFVGVSNSFNDESLRILATQMRAYSFFLVVGSDIETAADLKGKRIGITAETAGEFYMGQYLILNQLSLKDITVVYDKPDELVNYLAAGYVDAIVTFDPHIKNAQKRIGKDKLEVWQVQGDQRLSSMLYGTAKLTAERPEAVRRYISALAQAEEFILANNEKARDIVRDYLKYDDAYTRTIWSRFMVDLSLDQDLLINMEDQARWAIENKLTTATKVPDYLRFIYFDGLEAVKPDGITIIR